MLNTAAVFILRLSVFTLSAYYAMGVVPHEIQNKRGYAEGDRFLSAGEPRLCVRA